jgi:hypothetical protein
MPRQDPSTRTLDAVPVKRAAKPVKWGRYRPTSPTGIQGMQHSRTAARQSLADYRTCDQETAYNLMVMVPKSIFFEIYFVHQL